jgi:hypothetical protein
VNNAAPYGGETILNKAIREWIANKGDNMENIADDVFEQALIRIQNAHDAETKATIDAFYKMKGIPTPKQCRNFEELEGIFRLLFKNPTLDLEQIFPELKSAFEKVKNGRKKNYQ